MIRDGRLSGVEAEAHRAYEAKFHQRAEGFFIPPDVIVGTRAGMHQRDMNVNTFGAGGAFVQTSIATPIIELLRNRMVCLRLGAQSLAGLVGNCAIPRQTGAGTAYSLAESATLTKSMQAIDQILLTPHRVGAYNEYSKQLLLQSSVDVENFIRDDLMKVVAIRWDSLMLIGSGSSSEPTGILHTTGVGSVNFGATATLAKVVSFETALAAANADAGPMAYVVSPTVKAAWKTIPKIGSTMPIFIWEDGDYGDGSNDGKVNSYRAASTNQIPNNQVFFGRFQDLIQAMWGGYDVVVNPYSRDIDAMVRITVNTFGDIAVRHAASFAVSADSGAQ
jgi:HK97 family phage major capsid protein